MWKFITTSLAQTTMRELASIELVAARPFDRESRRRRTPNPQTKNKDQENRYELSKASLANRLFFDHYFNDFSICAKSF
jgi:hypothetical protein